MAGVGIGVGPGAVAPGGSAPGVVDAAAAGVGAAVPMAGEAGRAYDPGAVEGAIYQRWLQSGAFVAPLAPEPGRPRFSVVMPPPNVTGQLHMGHALDNTLQDVFVRWQRMRGAATLWVPGTDHAGIATHAVVERRLAAEGESRRTMGREAFVARIWEWKDEYEGRIVAQLRRLGCSCDWGRQRFTLDAGLSAAVDEVFIRYYREGFLYRDNYIVNWCPRCGTALSDLEVEHEEEASCLYRVRYPLVDGGEVVIATVRPETMLGDTAVAVHPDDTRYTALHGRRVILPLAGREIPVVADAYVDPAFGTGALKVTPAHDLADAEIGRRHGLPVIAVIGTDGRLTAEAGRFGGMTVLEARAAVAAALADGGFLVGTEEHRAPVGHCARCGAVIEPLRSLQWFVRMAPLCAIAADAVRAGRVRFHPESFTHIFLQWMDNAHDWCISRQIWWGHRIPAYECARCGEVVVARADEVPAACPRCGAETLERDPDVMDTWFSSALWPFSTMGWPAATPELAHYYPTDLLVTGRDIIFTWVARMVFSGIHFTGQPPFGDVLLHGLVRDAQGRKMSKSLGNGIDPIELVDRYGADALRHALLVGVAPGNDLRFAPEKIEGSQRFCNKLWNLARFALSIVEAGDGGVPGPRESRGLALALEDRWIIGRLGQVAEQVDAALARFDPGLALQGLTTFVWDELCDWYVEAIKGRLSPRTAGRSAGDGSAGAAEGETRGQGGGGTQEQVRARESAGAALPDAAACAASRLAAHRTLLEVLDGTLRLLHPFLPFITEAIWERWKGAGALLVTADWPHAGDWAENPEVARAFTAVREVVVAVRGLRAELRVPPAMRIDVLLPGYRLLPDQRRLLLDLARLSAVVDRGGRPGEAVVSTVVGDGALVLLPVAGLVDVSAERARLGREREATARERARTGARLDDAAFRTRARPEVVERETRRKQQLDATLSRLDERIAQLGVE